MKKNLFIFLFVALASLTASAIRPVHVAFPHRQSDGTTIYAYLHGDGYEAFYTTTDGVVLMRDTTTNDLCYATVLNGRLKASHLIAHEKDVRSVAEQAFAEDVLPQIKPAVAKEAVRMRKVQTERAPSVLSFNDGLGTYGQNSTGTFPSVGKYRIPVIMVEFQNKKFLASTTVEKVSNYLNQDNYNMEDGANGSPRQYFSEQSGGMFEPSFDVVAKVTLEHPYSYYGSNSPSQDYNVRRMVADAVAAAVADGTDFSQYEVNGSIPLVSIYYAGPGEATGGDPNTVWPHFLSYSRYMSGYRFSSYFVGNEIYGDSTSTVPIGMGVFVHEFGHALGLPDFYCTDYSYEGNSAFGNFDVMDAGAYNGVAARMPVGYTAFEKNFMGWLRLPELSEPQHVTLHSPVGSADSSAVLIRKNGSQSEYFILENRHPGKWYPSSLGSGLMLTRYYYNNMSWRYYNDVNNDEDRKGAMIVTANGARINAGGTPAMLFGNGYASIDSLTLYNGQKQYAGIKRIQIHNDSTCTFNFQTDELRSIPKVGATYVKVNSMNELASGDTVLIVNEASNMALSSLSGRGHLVGRDVYISNGTLWAGSDATPLRLNHTADNVHWTFSPANRQYLSVTTVRGNLGVATSYDYNAVATITISGGDASIQFIGKNKSNLIGFNADELNFAGYASDAPAIQLYKRQNVTSGISSPKVTRSAESDYGYTLTGIRVKKSDMSKGVYIVNGRKVVVK